VRAARTGRWDEALRQAVRAWALEFGTGRPFRRGEQSAWKRLRVAVEEAFLAHEEPAAAGVS
jgi:hypothetical protein